jgi:ABC-type iron transport system FetAB ATPase subunit
LQDLVLSYDGKIVLDGVDLEVREGEKATLTGPSGSGKSSVLSCILGFSKPDRGAVYIMGERMARGTVWKLRQQFAYVPQEPEFFPGRVIDLLERPFAFQANKLLGHNRAKRDQLFKQFLLPSELLEKEIQTLSGGEKQRIALLSAILLERKIFLLDEAYSALDRETREIALDYFGNREELTMLSVSHDPERFSFAGPVIELPGRRIS